MATPTPLSPAPWPRSPQSPKHEESPVSAKLQSDQNKLRSNQTRKSPTTPTPQNQNISTLDAPHTKKRTKKLKQLFEEENHKLKTLTRTPPTKRKLSQELPKIPHPTKQATLNLFSKKKTKPNIFREFLKIDDK